MKHDNLSLDELIHYGTLGDVQWLDADIAKRLETYVQDAVDEATREDYNVEELQGEIEDLEGQLNGLENEAYLAREVVEAVRNEFKKYPQLKNNIPALAEALDDYDRAE